MLRSVSPPDGNRLLPLIGGLTARASLVTDLFFRSCSVRLLLLVSIHVSPKKLSFYREQSCGDGVPEPGARARVPDLVEDATVFNTNVNNRVEKAGCIPAKLHGGEVFNEVH